MANLVKRVIAFPFQFSAACLMGIAMVIRFGFEGSTRVLNDMGQAILDEKVKH